MSDQVLVISGDASRRARLMAAVQATGQHAVPAESGAIGASALAEPGLDAIVVDLALPELDIAALRAALAPGVAAPESLEEVERRHIAAVLQHTGGNKRQAALLLGLARSTLLHKVRKYRIVTPRP